MYFLSRNIIDYGYGMLHEEEQVAITICHTCLQHFYTFSLSPCTLIYINYIHYAVSLQLC